MLPRLRPQTALGLAPCGRKSFIGMARLRKRFCRANAPQSLPARQSLTISIKKRRADRPSPFLASRKLDCDVLPVGRGIFRLKRFTGLIAQARRAAEGMRQEAFAPLRAYSPRLCFRVARKEAFFPSRAGQSNSVGASGWSSAAKHIKSWSRVHFSSASRSGISSLPNSPIPVVSIFS